MPVRRIASSVVIDAELGALLSASVTPLPDDAAEADVAGGGVDGLGVARRRTIAATVVRGAQMRAALQYLAWNADVRLAAVVTTVLRRAARILGGAAGSGRGDLMTRGVPVSGPLPDVADHVVESVAVRWIRHDGRCARVTVGPRVLVRKVPLPGVGHVPLLRREFIAPREFGAIEPTACGEFPLGFGRQRLAGPVGIGLGVAVGDVNDRMLLEARERAAWAVRTPPERAEPELPPLAPVAEVDHPLRWCEHQ